MAQDYNVTEVLAAYEAQFGKKRIAFKTEQTGDRSISTFTQYPDSLRVGAVIFGDIEEKRVDDRTFYNFKFGKKDSSPASKDAGLAEIKNILTLKVLPALIEILGFIKKPSNYPKMDESNNANYFEE